jgi:hypothetical protein
MTNFPLHDEQTINGFRKIAWASAFCFLFERQNIYKVLFSVYVYIETVYTENGTYGKQNFNLFAQMEHRNGKLLFVWYKQKQKTEVCFPWLANSK